MLESLVESGLDRFDPLGLSHTKRPPIPSVRSIRVIHQLIQ